MVSKAFVKLTTTRIFELPWSKALEDLIVNFGRDSLLPTICYYGGDNLRLWSCYGSSVLWRIRHWLIFILSNHFSDFTFRQPENNIIGGERDLNFSYYIPFNRTSLQAPLNSFKVSFNKLHHDAGDKLHCRYCNFDELWQLILFYFYEDSFKGLQAKNTMHWDTKTHLNVTVFFNFNHCQNNMYLTDSEQIVCIFSK